MYPQLGLVHGDSFESPDSLPSGNALYSIDTLVKNSPLFYGGKRI